MRSFILALTFCALSALAACATTPVEPPKVYQFTILVPGPMGIPVPVGGMLVRNLQRQMDGSLCFERVDNGVRACVKLFQYEVTEVESN